MTLLVVATAPFEALKADVSVLVLFGFELSSNAFAAVFAARGALDNMVVGALGDILIVMLDCAYECLDVRANRRPRECSCNETESLSSSGFVRPTPSCSDARSIAMGEGQEAGVRDVVVATRNHMTGMDALQHAL